MNVMELRTSLEKVRAHIAQFEDDQARKAMSELDHTLEDLANNPQILSNQDEDEPYLPYFTAIWSPWIIAERNRVLTWHWVEKPQGGFAPGDFSKANQKLSQPDGRYVHDGVEYLGGIAFLDMLDRRTKGLTSP